MNARRASYLKGIFAEFYCILFLLAKGYSILSRRYTGGRCEVDIVVRRGNTLVFVEVKARATSEAALATVTTHKQQRIQQAARAFISLRSEFIHHDLRFDVMVVTSRLRIIHLVNAWSAA